MNKVFEQCTVCYRPLHEREIKKHDEEENYYFTICDDCLNKHSSRIIKILEKGQQKK